MTVSDIQQYVCTPQGPYPVTADELDGQPGLVYYADHVAAVAAAEQRVLSDVDAEAMRQNVAFRKGVKAARDAVTAVQAERGHDAAINWSEIGNEYAEGWTDLLSLILPAIDALRGGS